MNLLGPIIFNKSGGALTSRVINLENNEQIYGLFEYTGISASGAITVPTGAVIYDYYGDGVLDAFMVEADGSENPTQTPSTNSSGQAILVSSLDNAGNYALSDTPSTPACIMYYIRIKAKDAANVPLNAIFEPALPIIPNAYGEVVAAKSNAQYTSIKDALTFANAQATASKPFIVRAFGDFTEDPFEVGPYVVLRGENCRITPTDQNNPLCTINTFGEVWGCRLTGPTNSYAVHMNASNTSFKNGAVLNAGLTAFYLGPLAAFAVIRDTTITSQTDKAFEFDGCSNIQVVNVATLFCNTGLYFSNGAIVNIANVTGVGNNIDLNQSDANSIVVANACSFNEDKIRFTNAQNLRLSYNSDKDGDIALNNLQEFRVGTAEQGYESIFGEGDSYTRGLLAYTRNTSNEYVDVSAEAASASGSTLTLPGVAADNMLYLSTDLKKSTGEFLRFFGFKHKILTEAVLGGGKIIIEYYNAINGWSKPNYMETQSDRRYYQYAESIFEHTGDFHVRGPVGLSIDENPDTKWDLSDDPGTGTPRYWIRIRIETAITTAPVFEQFKLHSNRSEFNDDGWLEHFGSARPKGTLPITLGAGRELSGNLQDSNIWIDDNLGVGLRNNRIANTGQYFGVGGSAPDDLDTGSLVELIITARGEAAGTVTLNVDYGTVTDGDSAYAVNTTTGIKKSVQASATFTAADELRTFRLPLDFSNIRVRKDPADGNAEADLVFLTISGTVLPTAVVLADLGISYFKWCEGGHI